MKTNVDPNSYDFFSSGKHKEYILILHSVLYFEHAITVIVTEALVWKTRLYIILYKL